MNAAAHCKPPAVSAAANLTEEERRQLRENIRPVMRQEMDNRMKAYFELPKEEKTAYLDKMLDEMEARREEREARRAQEQAENPEAAEQRPETRPRDSGRKLLSRYTF